jgi:hypothetical protein
MHSTMWSVEWFFPGEGGISRAKSGITPGITRVESGTGLTVR